MAPPWPPERISPGAVSTPPRHCPAAYAVAAGVMMTWLPAILPACAHAELGAPVSASPTRIHRSNLMPSSLPARPVLPMPAHPTRHITAHPHTAAGYAARH